MALVCTGGAGLYWGRWSVLGALGFTGGTELYWELRWARSPSGGRVKRCRRAAVRGVGALGTNGGTRGHWAVLGSLEQSWQGLESPEVEGH